MNWEQIAIGVLLLAHGVGHLLGILAAMGMSAEDWNARSWLLTPRLGEPRAATLGGLLWAMNLVGFVALGAAVLGWLPLGPWAGPVGIALALLSTGTLLLYWNAFPTLFPNKLGALGVNLAVLWAVWVEHWPTPEMLAG